MQSFNNRASTKPKLRPGRKQSPRYAATLDAEIPVDRPNSTMSIV